MNQPANFPEGSIAPASYRGQGFLAICGSLLWPGLGHLLVRQYRQAAAWFVAWLILSGLGLLCFILPGLIPALIVLLPLSIILGVILWIDAFRVARRSPPVLRGPLLRYVVGAVLLIVALFASPAMPVALLLKRYAVESFTQPDPRKLDPFFARQRREEREGGAMAPAVVWGDRFLVHKRLEIERWSIVVYESPMEEGQKWYSRVVGLPGESVVVEQGGVRINGQRVGVPQNVGPYVTTGSEYFPIRTLSITLGPDEYYVLGDNSPVALDARYWDRAFPGHQIGAVPRDRMIGVISYIYWPLSRWERLY